MLRKAVKQFSLGVKNPQQALRVLASEARMRAGLRTLRSIELAVTWICNLDCVFCYAEDLMKAQKKPPDMSVETVGKLTLDAHKLGLIHVNVTGGVRASLTVNILPHRYFIQRHAANAQ
jgi:2-iminoacetate synthase ThiH